jgi:hypothetical protein
MSKIIFIDLQLSKKNTVVNTEILVTEKILNDFSKYYTAYLDYRLDNK